MGCLNQKLSIIGMIILVPLLVVIDMLEEKAQAVEEEEMKRWESRDEEQSRYSR